MQEFTKEQVGKSWIRFVDYCESINLDYVTSDLPTIERIVKDTRQSKLMKYLKGYDKYHDKYVLEVLLNIVMTEQTKLRNLYSMFEIDSILYDPSAISDAEKAERDAYFTD